MASAASAAARAQLAPNGILRAAINRSNMLLVTGTNAAGEPEGVAPSMAAELARRLGVTLQYISYPHPDQLCDDAASKAWDIALVGADPARAAYVDFTGAYCEIQVTCIVPLGSPVKTLEELDRPNVRVAVKSGGAYDLWLTRHLKQATLVRAETLDGSYDIFHEQGLDALAGLRPKLLTDLEKHPGKYRIWDQHFMAVQQAIGCLKQQDGSRDGQGFLAQFVEEAKAGLVQELIDRHGVSGKLSVAA